MGVFRGCKGKAHGGDIKELEKAGVVFGIKEDVLLDGLCNNKQILIAEGIPPEHGEDAVIRMYEIKKQSLR